MVVIVITRMKVEIMKLSDLEHSAFWGGVVCLSCGWASSEEEALQMGECPQCGGEHVAEASELLNFVNELEGEES